MATLFLIRHAPVQLDLDAPSSAWRLSEEGRMLAARLVTLPVFHTLAAVYSSPEPKARATGAPLAARFSVPLIEHDGLSELKRGQSNIAGREAYEDAVRAAFASPHTSIGGWERAADARQRVTDTIKQLASKHNESCAVVSHGLVLSLLLAHLHSQATVDFDAWRAMPLPALAMIDTATWQVLIPFSGIDAWQNMAG